MGRALLVLLILAAAVLAVWQVWAPSEGPGPVERGTSAEEEPRAGPRLEGWGPRARDGLRAPGQSLPAPPYTGPWRLRLSGRVVTSEGAPVSGARLLLLVAGETGLVPLEEAEAGPDGRLRVEVRGAEVLREPSVLVAEADGHVYGFRRLEPLPAGAEVDVGDLALRGTGGALAGTVVGADGAPAEVELLLQREGPEGDRDDDDGGAGASSALRADEPLFALAAHLPGEVGWLSSSAAGGFRTGPLPPGTYRLRIEARGRHVREGIPAGTQNLLIVLSEPASSAGSLLEATVRFEGATDRDLSAGLDAWGSSLPSLPVFSAHDRVLRADPVEVLGAATAPSARRGGSWRGRAVSTWRVQVPDGASQLLVRARYGPFEDRRFGLALLTRSAGASPQEVLLPRAQHVSGHVRKGGAGLAARVEVLYDLGPEGAREASAPSPGCERVVERFETGSDGAFDVGGLPPGRGAVRALPASRWNVQGVADEIEPSPWVPVVFGSGAEVLLEVRAPARLTLHLAWPRGEPVPSSVPAVRVALLGPDGRRTLPAEAALTEGGVRLVVSHLPHDAPAALAIACGDAWLDTELLLPREQPYVLDLKPAARIEGRVLRSDGRPQRRGTLWAVPLEVRAGGEAFPRVSAEIGASGTFVLRPPAPGRYRLEAEDLEEGVLVPAEAETGRRGVELRARRAAHVEGRLLGAGEGDLRAFYVDAVVAGVPPERGEGAWCSADGYFEFAWPGDRPVTLVARAEDPRDTRVAVLELAAQSVRGARLVLRQGERVTGRVLDAQGRPAAGARLHLASALVDDDEEADAEGRFAFLGLPGDSFDLEVRSGARTLTRRVGPGEHTLTLDAR